MTEKRFRREAYAIYEKGNPICMTLRDCDKRLNELWEENEQLKKELHKIKVVNEMLSMDFANSEHELWEENEQLKNEVYDWKASAEDYLKLGQSLKKENVQLKNELVELHEICAYYEYRIKELKGDVE